MCRGVVSLLTLLSSNFQSGSPEDRTQRDPRIRRIWATSPRIPFVAFCSVKVALLSRSERRHSVGHLGVEPPVAEPPQMNASPAPKADVLPSEPVSDVVLLPSPLRTPSAHLFLAGEPQAARMLVCGSLDRRVAMIFGTSELPTKMGLVGKLPATMRTQKKTRWSGVTPRAFLEQCLHKEVVR